MLAAALCFLFASCCHPLAKIEVYLLVLRGISQFNIEVHSSRKACVCVSCTDIWPYSIHI